LGTLDDVLSRLPIIQRMLAGLLGMRGPGIVCHGTGGYAEYRDQQEVTNVHATSVAALPASCAKPGRHQRKSARPARRLGFRPGISCPRPPPRKSPPRLRHRCRSEEHTSELQSRENLVCRLLLAKKK